MQSQIFTNPAGRIKSEDTPSPKPLAPDVERPEATSFEVDSPEVVEAATASARLYGQAEDILNSDLFRASCTKTWRDPITCGRAVSGALDDLAEAHGPFMVASRTFDEMAELSRDKDGLIPVYRGEDGELHSNPVFDHFEQKYNEAEKIYSAAESALIRSLTVHSTVNIIEALELAGVTDKVLIAEICRCVIQGGRVFDGKGFTREGGFPASPMPSTPDKPFTPHELSAPNPVLNRAMNNRLEALLQKHEPDIFPQWLAHMEALGKGRDTNVQWGQSLAYAASLIPIANRNPKGWNAPEAFEQFKGRANRNSDLLLRLVLKGVVRRGEHKSNSEAAASQATSLSQAVAA